MPDSQIARELHEASIQSHWYVETPKEYVDKRVVKLKKQKLEKVVVLDLDETLIYYKPNQTIVRPFCQEFLERLSRICILVLLLLPKRTRNKHVKNYRSKQKYFKAICTSDHMIGNVKDLRIFKLISKILQQLKILQKFCVFSFSKQVPKSTMVYLSYHLKVNKMTINLNCYFRSQKLFYQLMMYAFNQLISLNYNIFIRN